MSLPVIACGYEITLNENIGKLLSRAFISVPLGTTNKIGLYFGSGSVGAPIEKSDTEIREWSETHQGACTLRLTEIYIKGIIFGKFIDEDGVEFLGVIVDQRNEKQKKKEGVMKAKENIDTFTKLGIKSCDITAIPYIWYKE